MGKNPLFQATSGYRGRVVPPRYPQQSPHVFRLHRPSDMDGTNDTTSDRNEARGSWSIEKTIILW